MGIETILKQHISSIKYYENLPCILVNGSQLFETDDKYIHKDLKRLNELNIINPLKKIMTDDNLTDKLNYSSLGVTVSKAINQFEISAVSKKYILFIFLFLFYFYFVFILFLFCFYFILYFNFILIVVFRYLVFLIQIAAG